MKKFQGNRTLQLATLVIDGKPVQANLNSIRKEDRQILHGNYKGVQVNSPEICLVGDSAVVWPEAGKNFAFAMTKTNLGVLSTKFLEADGHTVTLK